MIDERALRTRYGRVGADLATLLHRLARESGFTDLDAAWQWVVARSGAARDPAESPGTGVVGRHRAPEAVEPDEHPVPAGLVDGFLELWTRDREIDAARIGSVTDELTRLHREVVIAHRRTTETSSGVVDRADTTARLKDELLRVQRELIQSQRDEAQFRALTNFLALALGRLQDTHDRLTRERDELLVRAETAEAAVVASLEARTAGDQVTRAEHQLATALSSTTEAEELVRQLETRHAKLSARLVALEATVEAKPSPAPGGDVEPGELKESLDQHKIVLDRVEALLTEGGRRMEKTKQRLAQDDDPTIAQTIWSTTPEPSDEDHSAAQESTVRLRPEGVRDEGGGDAHRVSPGDMPGVAFGGGAPPRARWRRALRSIATGVAGSRNRRTASYEHELVERVNQALTGCSKVAVLSLKGGVGKTTVTVGLGSVFASLRDDRVIALDVDPHRGTLALKVPRETTATVRHLLRDASRISRHSDVRAYTTRASSRLEVLASEQDLAVSDAFSEQDYLRTIALLEPHYRLVLTDCGTGLVHPAMKGVLDQADSVVLVASGAVDSAQTSAATLDWLEEHGYRDLVATSVAVINSVRPDPGKVDLERLAAHFAQRCRAVVTIPFDEHLAEGAEIDPHEIGHRARLSLLELAAIIADGLPGTHRPPAAAAPVGADDWSHSSRIPPGTVPWTEKVRLLDLEMARMNISTYDYQQIRFWLHETADRRQVELHDPYINSIIGNFTRTIWASPPMPRHSSAERVDRPAGKPPWQQVLRELDQALALGNISVDEYRARRDSLLDHPGPGVPAAERPRPSSSRHTPPRSTTPDAGPIGFAAATTSWQEQLRSLDEDLARGSVSADEYRARRDSILNLAERQRDRPPG